MEALSNLTSTVIGKVMMYIIAVFVIVIIGMSSMLYFLKSDASLLKSNLETAKAEKISDELQKEALRSAIVDQNNAVEKQRIDAVQRAEEFKAKSDTIQAKYERERKRVSDLNGTAECNAIREIIKGAL
jgi:flagellar biosynthesis/type III secretory pathway M-ring protein FliF/YscJ